MNIAELFVNLGVKGADQAGKALGGIKTGLGEVKDLSLTTKAAILAVVYGLERMMSESAQTGTALSNFNALTGISTKELQQWQYAARQAGVSGDELAGSVKAVQNSMSNMLLGKGAPEGMAMLANKVGFDPSRARETLYVMGQLQKFAQSVPQDVGNQMIKSFGVSEGTIAAMRKNVFTPEMFKKAPTYSDGEINSLNKADVAWKNLGNKIEMAFGHLTAKHGTQIIGDISKITNSVMGLADALVTLAEKTKVFALIGKLAEGAAALVNLATIGVEETTGGDSSGTRKSLGKDSSLNKVLNFRDSVDKQFMDTIKSITSADVRRPEKTSGTQNINVNQNLHFQHDGKDHKKTGDSVHKAVKDTYRQMSAQAQGT